MREIKKAEFTASRDMNLGAAILACGIKQVIPAKAIDDLEKRHTTYVWHFEQENEDGTVKTRDLIDAWDDETFIANNPDHPFAFIMAAFGNRERMLDEIKQGIGYVQTRSGDKIILVNKQEKDAKKVRRLTHV